MQALKSVDPVTQFLRSQGLQPEVAYFERSDFVIGWRIHLGDLELVYRLEEDTLIVCDFTAKEGAQGTSGAVAQFVHLIHRIERNVQQLHAVRGMFIERIANPELNGVRERLASVLEAKGASWQEVDGKPWLVYPLMSKRPVSVGNDILSSGRFFQKPA
ncbi:hypothetical protein KVG95_21015 [Pseudomonas sp. SWRI79]|uniref:Secretion protein n=1 Tax=Pseudomonas farris TaxID=2841207 RepID=A0ABS6PZB4_9PSED|nr:hypothetical protein [Pseudomonas farris]MBV4465811.1 hypothetical protein [Pseudomonas farris]